jgi:hypothetical protein
MSDKKTSQFGTITADQANTAGTEGYIPYVDPSQIDPDLRNKRMTRTEAKKFFGLDVFTALSGTAWDGSNQTLTLTSNTALTFSSTKRNGILRVKQDATGGRTLSINSVSVPVASGANAITAISFFYDDVAATYVFSYDTNILGNVGGVGDTTAPTITGITATDAHTFVVGLSETVTGFNGFVFKRSGTPLTITGHSFPAPATIQFTVSETLLNTDTFTADYTPGDVADFSSNPLAAFTGHSVTNSIGSTTLNAPTGLTLGTATSTTQPLSWTDTNSSPNETGYKVYRNTVNNFGTATLATTTAANATSYTVTGLTASTLYYYWVIAAGNGTTTLDSTAATASGSTGAAGYDTDAVAYFTAAGITDTPTKDAYNAFIVALKSASIFSTHFDGLYLLCGGTEATSKLNIINPTDSDAAYRLTFNNSATFAATGVTGNGTNQTISSHFIPGLAAKMGVNDSHVAIYHRTSAGVDNPAWGINQTSKQVYLFPKESGGAGAFRYTNQSNISFTPSNAKGFWLARRNATNISVYKDATEINNALDNGNGEVLSPDYDIVFNGWNNNGTPALAHAGELSIISFGKYLDDTQKAAYLSAVSNLVTALGL